MRKVKLTKESTKDILETLLKRSPNNYGKYEDAVANILAKVKAEGDTALFAFTREFDKVEVTKDTIRVTPEEIEEAYDELSGQVDEIVRRMKTEMNEEATVIATGGLANLIAKQSTTIDKVEHFLTLDGLCILYKRNASNMRDF